MILFIKGLCAGIGIVILIALIGLLWLSIWLDGCPEHKKTLEEHIQ